MRNLFTSLAAVGATAILLTATGNSAAQTPQPGAKGSAAKPAPSADTVRIYTTDRLSPLQDDLTLLDAQSRLPEPGFTSLFNGKSLAGWQGNPALWSVQGGAIVGATKDDPKLTHNTFLVWTNGTPGDFELRLSFRLLGGNSGIQYRSKVIRQGADGPVMGGYQADMDFARTYTGILYEEQGRGILALRGQKVVIKEGTGKPVIESVGSLGTADELKAKIRAGDWNDYVIIAQGNHLEHFINGAQTVDIVDEQNAAAAKSGRLGLQLHVGPAMRVEFKNLRIRELK